MNRDIAILKVRKNIGGTGRKLARHFNCREITAFRSPLVKLRRNSVVLNYGNSNEPVWLGDALSRGVIVLNTNSSVRDAVDKVRSFELLEENVIPSLDYTTDYNTACGWAANGHKVIVRSTATGKRGVGMSLYDPTIDGDEDYELLPLAPLYTRHYAKTHEFRVFVVCGRVVDITQKKRMSSKKLVKRGIKEPNELIRSHERGWIFAHNKLAVKGADLTRVKILGHTATIAVGLDFCGVDILAKVSRGKLVDAVVCEVNSAPSIKSPTTFKLITDRLQQFIDERKDNER